MMTRVFCWLRQSDASAAPAEENAPKGASRGQILVMFAFFLTAMMGMLGLAVDLGFAFSQRRTVQNAADLSAVAGARSVARFKASAPVSALPDVQNLVDENLMGPSPLVLEECYYIDQYQQNVGDCVLTVPANATGVVVTVSETHGTFFIRVVPGAPSYVTTRATASAQVERLDLAGMDAPFIVCGYDAKRSDGSEQDLLVSDYALNPDAIGNVFKLSGPSATDIGRCGTPSSGTSYGARWRGLADKEANNGKRIVLSGASTASWWNPKIGSPSTNVSTVTNKVNGIEGCQELANKPFNCIMLVPIAVDYDSSVRRFKVTKVMAFDVWRDDSSPSTFYGRLIDDYIAFGASVPLSVDQAPWCRDCGSVVVVRLAS